MIKKTRKCWMWMATVLFLLVGSAAVTACGDDELKKEPEKTEERGTKIMPKISGKYIKYDGEIIIDEDGCEISESCRGYSLVLPDYIKSISLKRFIGSFTDENQWFQAGECTMKLIGDSELRFENGGDMKIGTIYLKGNGSKSSILKIKDFAVNDFEIKKCFKSAPGWVVKYSDVKVTEDKEQIDIEVIPEQ